MPPLQAKEAYQSAYTAFFGYPAPEVRISVAGGFYVRQPVERQYTHEDLEKITRFFQRGAQ